MPLSNTKVFACLAALVASGCATFPVPLDQGAKGAVETALDAYVNAPDANYAYEMVHYIDGPGYRGYVLDMVSQAWLNEAMVDRPMWQHWLVVVVPDEVKSDTGMLFIGGGDNGGDPPLEIPERLSTFAVATQTVVSQLYMVPNQPLTYIWDETQPRWEDASISYTWDKFLRTGDDIWPMRLPMTKSAVRAMDTITEFCVDDSRINTRVDKFVVAGGSKRGWTTWTTAAVDDRVVAIAPIVIDLLNIEPSFIHHFEVYGKYAAAVQDYEDMGLMDWMGTREYRNLMELVEPYEYLSRYTMPKFLLNATGDQFFIPDSSQFYFDDLPGEKYLRYVENTGHGMGGSDMGESLLAWYDAIVTDTPRPKFTWLMADDGTLRVHTTDAPSEVRLWRASNATARNFQKQTIGISWSSTVLPDNGDGNYVARVAEPAKGWTAFYVELTYPSGTAVPFKFTTAVRVTPDVKPYNFRYSKKKDREKSPEHR